MENAFRSRENRFRASFSRNIYDVSHTHAKDLNYMWTVIIRGMGIHSKKTEIEWNGQRVPKTHQHAGLQNMFFYFFYENDYKTQIPKASNNKKTIIM